MLNSEESNRRSDKNEADVKEQFEKLGYVVEKLDRKASKGRRPDFLISDRAGRPQILCEVKTVDSGGYLQPFGKSHRILNASVAPIPFEKHQ